MISVKVSKINAVNKRSNKKLIMNANNNSAVNNNNSNNTEATSMKKYTIEIADRTGHTTMADLTIEEATNNILENAESNARWVFINGEKFEFEGSNYRTEANIQKLQAKLEALNDPAVLLTGVLVGGLE
jgi:hypothetical protein